MGFGYFLSKVAETMNEAESAIRFSEDEWLAKLFVADAPEGLLKKPINIVGAWAAKKYQRCRGQIGLIFQQRPKNNVSVVLDRPAAKKEQRDIIRKKVSDNGAWVPAALCYIF
jgi:hypothetical protein